MTPDDHWLAGWSSLSADEVTDSMVIPAKVLTRATIVYKGWDDLRRPRPGGQVLGLDPEPRRSSIAVRSAQGEVRSVNVSRRRQWCRAGNR